ncbi:SGNH/GDSL hydrolase family protein [Demequina rhizosphaerae]|uniref:SGNH/GDSL hydrolase family protein n=1 Tax=Demequina rhizosphaerae TaxID=1638985 RepID=UPI000786666D|nr:SGNH/GDSL hydrolase family protein [Demequina rhizosphaerae]
MAKRRHKHPSQQHWLNRDYGGMPGWGIVLSGLFIVGVAGLGAWKYSQPEPVPSWTPAARESTTPEPSASEAPERLRVSFVGDSYTWGGTEGWPSLLGAALDFEVEKSTFGLFAAQGGTGYVTVGTADGAERFGGRVDEIVAAAPNFIIVAGGINDGRQDTADVASAADDFYGRLRAGLPEARIVVVGPFSPIGEDAKKVADRDAIFTAAEAHGVTDFIDPLPWFGDGGVEISDDGVHPTVAGHAQIADHMIDAVGPIVDDWRSTHLVPSAT